MEQSLTLIRRGRTDLLQAPISAFESDTQAVIQATAPFHERAIMYVVAAMVVLALVLMWVVKLDRVVSGYGRILPMQGSLFVQPLDRAIVTGIETRAGDIVRKGQVLATLDPTFAQADLRDLQQKKAAAEALVARLQAESDGRSYTGNPSSPESMLQAAIFAQRQGEYQQSLADLEAQVRSGQSAVERANQDQENYAQRLRIASEAEAAQQKLVDQGFGRKLSLLNAIDTRVEMQRMMAESRDTAVQQQHQVAALSASKAAFISKWRGDIATQLVTAQNNLSAILQSLAKASKISDLSKLVAPADAVVLKVGKANIGSVIDPSTDNGEPLFTLTPLAGKLQAELHINARDIGFIKPGDKVSLKLDAYQFTAHGTAKGIIRTISDGSFTTSDDGQIVTPYYKAIVSITDVRLRNVPSNFRLTPGLTLTGEVLIGRRTIMQYLFSGALRTGSEAMREPS